MRTKYSGFMIIFMILSFNAKAQFHSLTLPMLSPKASVSQQLGVTFINIEYHSPFVRGRQVWENPNVIPQNGQPFAWRAGAQSNTTIAFDTDVLIEGKPLAAGKYGFHILANEHEHTLLFARPNNLWGSYYLDIENDVVLSVTVKDTTFQFHEHLTYHFDDRTDSSLKIHLSWADRTIPFSVAVDLNKTTLAKLRVDLNGESTYQWEAWNDAAAWCLQRNTNLEEALVWVNRSINGGLGGFAANKNLSNLGTKAQILKSLERPTEAKETFKEGFKEEFSKEEAQAFVRLLLVNKEDQLAVDFSKFAMNQYKDDWVLLLFQSVGYYYLENSKKAINALKLSKKNCPDWFMQRANQIQEQMQSKSYHLGGRA